MVFVKKSILLLWVLFGQTKPEKIAFRGFRSVFGRILNILYPLDVQGGSNPTLRLCFFLEDKTSVPDVFSSCLFIPQAHIEISSVTVSFYGNETWRHK